MMWEDVPLSFLDVGATGLLALTVLLVLAGRLIPRKTHEQVVRILEASLQAEVDRGRIRDEQLSRLIDSTRRTVESLEAVRTEAANGDN